MMFGGRSDSPPRRKEPQPERNWWERNPKKTLFFLLAAVVVGLTAATEKILATKSRIFNPHFIRYIVLRENPPLYRGYCTPEDSYLKYVDSLEKKNYLLRIDDKGFIIPSKIHEHADVTLAFLGGSTTECLYMDEKSRFPYLAGRLLEQETGLKINSYNAARGGNNSLHSIDILLNKVIPLRPDAVIMMHNINDLNILLFETSYWVEKSSRSPVVELRTSLGKSLEQTFHLIRDAAIPNVARGVKQLWQRLAGPQFQPDEFGRVRGKKSVINKSFFLSEFRMNLQTFVSICQARNITPVLMTQESRLKEQPDAPIRHTATTLERDFGVGYREYKELFDLFNETIREVGAQNKVLVIDLDKKVPKEKEYMYDVAHMNENGSRLAAGIISRELRAHLPFRRKMPQKTQPPALPGGRAGRKGTA
jgi:hypothetical protein